jgi:hypothetical protein
MVTMLYFGAGVNQ